MIYANVKNHSPRVVKVDDALERIAGKKKSSTIEKVKALRDTITSWQGSEEELEAWVKNFKTDLVSYRFSGVFTSPSDAGLAEHSGFICLDFDAKRGVSNLGPYSPEHFKKRLSELPFVYAAFVSPTGAGVKALIRIPNQKGSHRGFFKGLQSFFTNTEGWYGTDATSVNESRICFESHDPEIYINKDAEIWEVYESVISDPSMMPVLTAKNKSTDFGAIERVISIVDNAVVGERHQAVLKAGKLLGGFIGGKLIKADDVYIVEQAVIRKFQGEDPKIEIRALHDGIRTGMAMPIYSIDSGEPVANEVSNGIIRLNDIRSTMLKQRVEGKPRGYTTGFPTLDPHYTFKNGEINLISGIPASGKTTFMVQLDLIQSLLRGVKWCVFSPENFPADEFYDTVIEQLTGKSTDSRFSNYISEEEYEAAMKFVNDHFFYIYPQASHTIYEIEANIQYISRYEPVGGVIIDPFNQLEHGKGRNDRDDLYIGAFLAERQRFAREMDFMYQIIVHPNKVGTYKDTDGKTKYLVPDYYDLNGGSVWSAKIDNFLVGERPNLYQDKRDPMFTFHSKKIKKQKRVGLPGAVEFRYDVASSRYLDMNNYNPIQSLWDKIYKKGSPSNSFYAIEAPAGIIDGDPF